MGFIQAYHVPKCKEIPKAGLASNKGLRFVFGLDDDYDATAHDDDNDDDDAAADDDDDAAADDDDDHDYDEMI